MAKLVVHEVYEAGTPREYPILEHVFRGDTEEEAHAVYLAHLESDAFLRGCVEDSEYRTRDANGRERVVKCFVRWWYDDDDAYDERVARAWIETRRGRAQPQTQQAQARTRPQTGALPNEVDGPPIERLVSVTQVPARGFRPRLIEGGAGGSSSATTGSTSQSGDDRPPGHEDHDPDLCSVRTG